MGSLWVHIAYHSRCIKPPKIISLTTMGNKPSTQRQLGKTISKATTPLKETPQLPLNPPTQPPFTPQPQAHGQSQLPGALQFDAAKLTKKLKNKGSGGPMPPMPPGKDGMDPQMDGTLTYDTDFISSITKLGRQIQSREQNPLDLNDALLRQLKSRRTLFELGEAQKHDHDHKKTMVHPQTLLAMLNELADGATPNKVADDYNMDAKAVEGLQRFRVAKTVVVVQDETKEGDLGHRKTGSGRIEAEDNEGFDQDRLKKLKSRISVDS